MRLRDGGGTHTYQGLRKADISAKKCQEKGEEVPARCQECGCFKEPQRVVALAATLVCKGLTRPEALLLADKAADGLPRVALRGKTSKGVCAHAWSCVGNILPVVFSAEASKHSRAAGEAELKLRLKKQCYSRGTNNIFC